MNYSQQSEPGMSQSLDRKQRLKRILDEGQKIERDFANQESNVVLNVINTLIQASDDIINEGEPEDRAEHTTEVVMDSHILKMNHELLSKVIHQNMEFSEKSYQNAIVNVIERGPIYDWDALANLVCTVPHTVHIHSSMLGAVESELKQTVAKERKQRSRVVLGQETRPETISKLKRQDKGSEKMNELHKQLGEIFRESERRSIPFYKLIVDPKNFMNSVENAFQLAFLARDGTVAVDIGADGHPEVRLVQSAEKKIQVDTSQWICSLDEDKCNKMAKLYKIKEPMLKIENIANNDDVVDDDNGDDDMENEEEYLDSD